MGNEVGDAIGIERDRLPGDDERHRLNGNIVRGDHLQVIASPRETTFELLMTMTSGAVVSGVTAS